MVHKGDSLPLEDFDSTTFDPEYTSAGVLYTVAEL
jgi:hypothetical protein